MIQFIVFLLSFALHMILQHNIATRNQLTLTITYYQPVVALVAAERAST